MWDRTETFEEDRKFAEDMGGVALTTTPFFERHLARAENIRRRVLEQVPSDVAKKLLTGEEFQSVNFWVDIRDVLLRPKLMEGFIRRHSSNPEARTEARRAR